MNMSEEILQNHKVTVIVTVMFKKEKQDIHILFNTTFILEGLMALNAHSSQHNVKYR